MINKHSKVLILGAGGVVPSIILGSACTTSNGDGKDYYVIRSEADVDEAFDFNKFPNDPVRVGNIASGKVGLGHSAVLVDDSSEYTTYPSGPFTWWSNRMITFPQGLPGRAIREFRNGSDPFDEATLTLHPEPKQGGGSIRVPTGVDTWPCMIDADGDTWKVDEYGDRSFMWDYR